MVSVGKRYWRSFLPIWLFPIAFLATLAMPRFSTHSAQYFFLLDLPLMGLCAYPALRRWQQGGLTFAQMFLWFAIVPVLIRHCRANPPNIIRASKRTSRKTINKAVCARRPMSMLESSSSSRFPVFHHLCEVQI
jgi:hypothetical protein